MTFKIQNISEMYCSNYRGGRTSNDKNKSKRQIKSEKNDNHWSEWCQKLIIDQRNRIKDRENNKMGLESKLQYNNVFD